ncbi:MAG: putative 4Fe-4S ferredoxin, iron-sulfur binding [Gammaproteobacteria bacterium]|nr:putative 4Fe-4S ferredoxin, iron-sulfur binding [Gammaproteobacteria bacterium]
MPPVSGQWRSLAEWAQDPAFLARAAQEFPGLAEALSSPHSRRRVLKLMAAAFAMGGLDGCDIGAPGGRLIPAVRTAPNIIPGLADFYTTASVVDGFATGVLVKQQMGRPIKVEGNPQHPASLGATDVFAQAQVLDFYDPDRSAAIALRRHPSDRQAFLTALTQQRTLLARNGGAGFRILTGTITSPTLGTQLDVLLSRYPQARWHQWNAVSRDNAMRGAVLAYGQPVDIVPKLDPVDVLLAIDSDLLSSAPGHLRFARELIARRNPTRGREMNRIYALEPTPTLIGAAADHRFIAGPRDLQRIVARLAAAILQGAPTIGLPEWVGEVSADLTAHPGHALVHVGPDQPAEIHALVHAINEKLGARAATLDLIAPVAHAPADQSASLRELVEDMHAGKVSTLLIIDSNPVFSAPGALGFTEALAKVSFSVALTPTPDETFNAAIWAVPMCHSWEGWSDACAYDGTATILQPQALPLYDGVSPHEMLALCSGAPSPGAAGDTSANSSADTMKMVQATWMTRMGGNFAAAWHDALASGIVTGTRAAAVNPTLRADAVRQVPPALPDRALTMLFRPDPHLWDGRYANNAWLQELPRPLTKLTWDNPLLIAPDLARKLQVRNGDQVRLSSTAATAIVPVWIQPGQAPDCVVALLGFGRTQAGAVGQGAGFDFYPLVGRTDAATLQKVEGHVHLASTDHHNLIFDAAAGLVRRGTLAQYRQDPHFLGQKKPAAELYRWQPEGPAAWAMSIDLNACIGCNACVVACQAENNTPVVGKEQVLHEREMHWLRIDRYWEGEPHTPRTYFQPILCMHCEQAPCEVVCPVGATVHDSEGLNVMVYNRCVGTRFCSNNCPYKVRRFNYFDYAQEERRPPQSRNPDVSVRARGVMEKCTFCLQRIAEARIIADRENHPVGKVKTACQAACPTQAITFGDLRDPASEVARRKQSPLDYGLLEEQNTHPRVTYEARIRNINSSIKDVGG